MPVTCKLRKGKYRIVEPSGKIAKTDKGNAVDGGGHATMAKCQKQAAAINSHSEGNIMDKKNQNKAPASACVFGLGGDEVTFAEAGEKQDERFSIIAYSGGVITDHWFWGNIAFDLTGVKFDKKKTAVLEEHFTHLRVGFTTKQDVSDQIAVEGKFLTNDVAQGIRSDIQEGFPMQASIFLRPSLIEHVKEGEQAKVNKIVLKGPGTIFRKGRIHEVSMCTLGADKQTQSKAFAEGGKQEIKFNVIEKEHDMETNQIELNAETFAADYPELFGDVTAKAKAEGETETRALFTQFADQFSEDPAFCVEQFKAGLSLSDAITAENTKLRKAADEAAVKASQQAATSQDLAAQEFSDDAANLETPAEPPKTPEEKYTAEFNASAEIQEEFGGAKGQGDYIAFRKNEDAGRVGKLGK